MRINTLILMLIIFVGACARYDGDYKLPGVYRIDIQQGNVIDQEMLDRLQPGMNKNQVRFIMGTPAIEDPFHVNRWDYIFTYSLRGGGRSKIHIVLYFEEDELAFLDGDVISAIRKPTDEYRQQSRMVDVPIRGQRSPGLFGRMVDAIPFIGDDEAAPPEVEEQTETDSSEQPAE